MRAREKQKRRDLRLKRRRILLNESSDEEEGDSGESLPNMHTAAPTTSHTLDTAGLLYDFRTTGKGSKNHNSEGALVPESGFSPLQTTSGLPVALASMSERLTDHLFYQPRFARP